ncbi:hypothetical protein [Acidobacterium sp. S8]|uniref:hypothetical protein n=1 Tax=Acidobacterium sp. S8 TaxID=1641854 RepID=UPI00131E795D|nr:hypothetical protein [Acidobacterium sp. S8]
MGTKVLVVVLVVVVVIFVVFTVMGANTNKSVKTTGNPTTDASGFNPADYSLTNSLGPVLAKFGPKLSAKQMKPSATSFNLQTKPTFVVTVAADSSNQFRTAKFQMRPASGTPCALISYVALNPPSNVDSSLKKQQSDSNSKNSSSKYQPSIVVLSGGGTITVQRGSGAPAGSCVVSLNQ